MVNVVKADGSKEPFSQEKVSRSIRRAGVPASLHEKVLKEVKRKVYNNIPTFEIYQNIIDALSRSEQPYSRTRFSLKQAIMMLGPTGYPFEDFIAKVLAEKHFRTKTRQILRGRCVSHEIDVIAEKEGRRIMIEAKFHNSPGTRSEVQVALYVKARFDDIKDKYDLNEAWIVTNTKTTIDADAYAQCSGMKVISWNSPSGGSLSDMIEELHLHPVTMLTTLSASQKMKLLSHHVVLCKDLQQDQKYLSLLGLPQKQREDVLEELKYITQTNGTEPAYE